MILPDSGRFTAFSNLNPATVLRSAHSPRTAGIVASGTWISPINCSEGSIRAQICLGQIPRALATSGLPSDVTSDPGIPGKSAGSAAQRTVLHLPHLTTKTLDCERRKQLYASLTSKIYLNYVVFEQFLFVRVCCQKGKELDSENNKLVC